MASPMRPFVHRALCRRTAIPLIASACALVSLSACGVPETRIIKVPVVKTTVITKTVAPPQSHKQESSLPESCRDAISLTQDLANSDNTLAGAAGRLDDALTDVQTAAVMKDMKKLQAQLKVVKDTKELIDNEALRNAALKTDLDRSVHLCREATK